MLKVFLTHNVTHITISVTSPKGDVTDARESTIINLKKVKQKLSLNFIEEY